MIGPLPANLFGSSLGLIGLGLVWQRAGGTAMGDALAALGALVFAVLAAGGIAAAVRMPARAAAAFAHPIQRGFFCAISMSVLALALAAPWPAPARALWAAGAAGHALLALAIAARWVADGARMDDLDAPAFLPVFGSLFVPIGVAHGDAGVSWAFFAVAVTAGLPLYACILARSLRPGWVPSPTIVIALAPWALCVLACDALGGVAARWMLDAAAILAAAGVARVVVAAPRLARLPFGAAWWSCTFPSTALAAAALVYADRHPWARGAATALVGLATVVVAYVALRSLPLLLRWRRAAA
jgi:tellurite resistance protein